MSGDPQPPSRETWNTRGAFVLAAIGSAVGLGNLWSFPYKLYTYGGGAFLIPYFIAMIVVGVPLLIMEFSVGHWAQESPPGAFAAIAGRYRYVGWWLTLLAFVIISYYTIILGYCVIMLIESLQGIFSNVLPWAGGVKAAGEHFEVYHVNTVKDSFELGGIRWHIVAAAAASWAMIYLCLFKGVKWVSKVVILTVPLPWIMLTVLTMRGLTLPGAMTGLHFYLEPDWTKLAESDTWRWAFGQVFFSMSLGFAVMLCYASFLHRRSDLNNNALIVGLGDLATSFVAGIAVFSTVGAMAMADNKAVDAVVGGGPGLAFVTFPYALSKLPAAQGLFSSIFFIALLTLGIDSAFSIVEACLAATCDAKKKWPRAVVLPIICVVGFATGLIYCVGKGGLNILGLVDGLINGPFGILLVAFAECIIVGWAHKGSFLGKMREHANQRSDWKLGIWWDTIVKYIAPGLLLVLISWSVSDFVRKREWQGESGVLTLAGFALFAFIPFAIHILTKNRSEESHHPTEPLSTRDDGLAGKLLLILPTIAVAIGSLIGYIRLLPVEALQQQAKKIDAGFVEKELGPTAYVILSLSLAVIIGGLIWCFWKALQAAGSKDTEIEAGSV